MSSSCRIDDLYDPDDVLPINSPPLRPLRIDLSSNRSPSPKHVRYDGFEDEAEDEWPFGQLTLKMKDNDGFASTLAGDTFDIAGITNPQIEEGFICNYLGCTAQPFQTQYLLNSHSSVHSSNRPHYCEAESCPHSAGGKSSKRKKEMIRYRLVHDSPGYVCPLCPDKEHKYPRPDNLQRLIFSLKLINYYKYC